MDGNRFYSNILLLVTALVWGLAFVAQRVGMDFMGPMLFNGLRFSVGALSLVPVMLYFWIREAKKTPAGNRRSIKNSILPGVVAGLVLFVGSTLQQTGIVDTTAGNAGFVTGLYVILVPIMGRLWGQKTELAAWIGALLAIAGMFFLLVKQGFVVNRGDLMVLFSSVFWAIHVHVVGHASRRHDPLFISLIQYLLVAGLSLLAALFFEPFEFSAPALPAILYGGIGSVGVAYTLQIVAQKHAHPSHAAIILSLEGAFAALGGWILLHEYLTPKELSGAGLMLVGMVVSQLSWGRQRKKTNE